jgi:hypothetical protein
MSILLIHLSDIHIQDKSDSIVKRSNEIAATTFSVLPNAEAVFIVISGDVAQSGRQHEYDIALSFLLEIKEKIQREKNVPVEFVVAPGNHDCNFEHDDQIRQMAISCLSKDSSGADDSVIDACTKVQEEFFSFHKKLIPNRDPSSDKLWVTQSFDFQGAKLVFDTLNLAWVSKINEEQGGIFFPHEKYHFKKLSSGEVRLVVMHHPLNWFHQGMYKPFRKFIRDLASIVVTGHEHQGNLGELIDTESGQSAYIEADVLQDRRDTTRSAFNLVELDFSEDLYKSTKFQWNSKSFEISEDGSWSEFRNLPTKRHDDFEINSAFRSQLDDPGAIISDLGGSSITLSDFFIFPDMLMGNGRKGATRFMSSSILRDPVKIKGGVILEGDEKVGSTSLLYQLFDAYFEQGLVPVLIDGSSIKSLGEEHLKKVVNQAVEDQYGSTAIQRFDQLSKSKKILLIDNFDDIKVRTSAGRADFVSWVQNRFDCFVLTVGQFFEAQDLRHASDVEGTILFAHYQIQSFGYSLRGKLIRKWCHLENDGTEDDATLIGKIDQAEKTMDAIIGRNIIPSMPLYLLTLMQSLGAGRSGEFKDSALGHYYEYLLIQGLGSAGIPKNKLNEYFDYCTELAWFYHQQGNGEIEEVELAAFNKVFCDRWHRVDFQEQIARLVKAKVLISRGNFYSFRYPYIYYFLKGRYLSRNISDAGIATYIKKCCEHLYVREHANTILFLAHHTNDRYVVETILSVLRGLFDKHQPVLFNGDTQSIASLISDSGKLKYSETSPEDYREKVNETRDQIDDGKDGLSDVEESTGQLSLIAQLITLFKTVEILGQVLKNQYSNIERARKTLILEELFSGPLRALTGFYEFISINPDLIVSVIDSALKAQSNFDDETRTKIAKQTAARLIQGISLGFICKASSSVNSEALREDIAITVKRLNQPAYRLIEMGVLLDSAGPIPKELLLKLKEDTRGEAISDSLLHLLVLRRLYMFKTPEQDKQWLASKIDVGLAAQHALEFRSSKSKRLK